MILPIRMAVEIVFTSLPNLHQFRPGLTILANKLVEFS